MISPPISPVIGIRREDISKKGELRTPLTPQEVARLSQSGIRVIAQPAAHPHTGEVKRAFLDADYREAGASIQEDLSSADIILGIKEIDPDLVQPGKIYILFSHTHKGQIKNRPLLRRLAESGCTLLDYELITNEHQQRLLTAFTYVAGYAGMTDTLWALGRRWLMQGIENPFTLIPQSIERADLDAIRFFYREAGSLIREYGTPEAAPPLITCFLGNGKTSSGAQQMYDLLPVETLSPDEVPQAFESGSRHRVYKVVLEPPDMFRPRTSLSLDLQNRQAFSAAYYAHPQHFESNMERLFPYCTVWVNCILWSDKYPRLLSREQARAWHAEAQTLQVIGDISCDPEGAIQFSQETWIDEPVFIYNPESSEARMGWDGPGIAVMAVTNLPCEFPLDASARFAAELSPLLDNVIQADFHADSPESAGLADPLARAAILWKGQLTERYRYMQAYIESAR